MRYTTACFIKRSICTKVQQSAFIQRSFSSKYPSPQSIEDVEAKVEVGNNEAMNFSLSGTGPAFFAWMTGFCHGLREAGLVSSKSNYMGVSGGAMCSMFLAADLDMSSNSDIMVCGQEQSDRCRDGKQNLSALVSNMAEDLISEDVLPKLLDKTNVNIAVAQGSLPKAYSSEILLYNQFTDKQDIVNVLNATTHLPYISNGNASTTYRGREVIDAGLTGQMFVPTNKNFEHINIFPPYDYIPQNENAFGKLIVRMYAKLNNKAKATVHAHPYMAKDFGLGIFGMDDLMVKPLAKDEALLRHQLGYEAFLKWFEACRILLQVVKHAVRRKVVDQNLHLVYALIYHQRDLNTILKAKSSPFKPVDTEKIRAVMKEANTMIQEASARNAQQSMEILQKNVHVLKGLKVGSAQRGRIGSESSVDSTMSDSTMNGMEDFKFTYEEEADPETFFVPYVWDVIVSTVTSNSLEWDRMNIKVFAIMHHANDGDVSGADVDNVDGVGIGEYAKDAGDVV